MSKEQNQFIQQFLQEHAEKDYSSFSAGLIPGAGQVMGVRLPKLRELAKCIAKEDWLDYLTFATDNCMEETMLQGMTLGYVREPFDVIQPYLNTFISKIKNWSVCDSACASLKVAGREPERVRTYLQPYLESDQEFEIRFGVVMLLDHYIVPEYIDDVLAQLDQIQHPGYYVKMAVAWNLSVCYVRFPEKTMAYLEHNKLDDWTYNKSIQKMIESFRISVEDKEKLKAMKRSNN
jgi:3-methyladenine DNA glycosylase AlkD